MIHLGDITKISGYDAPVVDCVVGGSPCQDLSVAGKRAGLDGERSGLFMEQIRIVKEMREKDVRNGRSGNSVRPRYMVWENVPGAFSSNKGEDFRVVLEETAKIADKDASIPMPNTGRWQTSGCILGDGWSIAWRVLDAQFWGVPQRRRRIALIADFGGQSSPEILFVRKSVSRDIEQSQPTWQAAPCDAQGSTGEDDNEKPKLNSVCFDAYQHHGYRQSEVCGTITAGQNNSIRGDTPLIAAPYTLKIRSGCEGGGKGALVQEDKSATLATNNDQYLFQPVVYDARGNGSGVVANTITGGHESSISDYTCVVVEPTKVYWDGKQIAGTITANNAGGNQRMPDKENFNCVIEKRHTRYIVRRLTPLECERLQGYPDGWTDIGEYTDSNGKKKKSSDAARYKALGNSIALPPWKWVMKRLCACYERDATLASLFDGIGGFPYIWEQINGKGSCLWASEIEEFPIAVTKVRLCTSHQ